MKILFLGWEFPPYISGGMGIYAYELTRELSRKGVEIIYVMPDYGEVKCNWMKIVRVPIKGRIGPYGRPGQFKFTPWRWDILNVAIEYNKMVVEYCKNLDFDIIHANDWLTMIAAVELKRLTGKPLVVTVHSTEYDRSPAVWWDVYRIEKYGMENADIIITVSNREKELIVRNYGIPPEKIVVVYNGINPEKYRKIKAFIEKDGSIVLFVGRMTTQKGVDYLLEAAKLVLEKKNNVRFLLAGTGADLPKYIEKAIELGIQDRVMFLGFVPEEEKVVLYKIADVVICPSVSEPFGIVPLEALSAGTPVIISKQSGVSEVLSNALRVDFWDVREMASKILEILYYRELKEELREHGMKEVENLSWSKTAENTINVYRRVLK